ncbi:hypothetical protein HY087_00490, partial [Candidatus Gottesmanbacteria bacterium]|nr:hypothetical protein [Candidatus Gottesmanbacteria bacterium]
MGNKIDRVIMLLFVLVLYGASYIPLWKNFQRVPKDRYYFGSVDYAIDVLGNLTTVRQGFLGHWQRRSPVTTTIEGKPTYLKFEYIAIGQLARMGRVDPTVMYYLARSVISLVVVVMIVWLVYQMIQKPLARIAAIAMILFATGITEPWKSYPYRIMDVMPGDTMVFQRLTLAAPHYLLGILLPLCSIVFLARFIDRKKFSFFLLSVASGMLGTLVYTPSMVLVVLSLPLLFLKKKTYRGAIFLYAILSLLPVIYIRYVSQFWDFSAFSKTEFVVPFRLSPLDYPLAVGVPFLLALFSLKRVLTSKNTMLLILFPWLLTHPFATLVVAYFAHINPSRFFFGPYFVVFGILGALGIKEILAFVRHKTTKTLTYLFGAVLMLTVFAPSYISYGASMLAIRTCFCNVRFFDYGYPKKDLMDAIFWLRDHTSEFDTVLSGPYTGAIIPAFSANPVYTSWCLRIMDEQAFGQTEDVLKKFYSGTMPESEVRRLIADNHISYVLVGDQEKTYGDTTSLSKYPFLTPVASFGTYRLIHPFGTTT